MGFKIGLILLAAVRTFYFIIISDKSMILFLLLFNFNFIKRYFTFIGF